MLFLVSLAHSYADVVQPVLCNCHNLNHWLKRLTLESPEVSMLICQMSRLLVIVIVVVVVVVTFIHGTLKNTPPLVSFCLHWASSPAPTRYVATEYFLAVCYESLSWCILVQTAYKLIDVQTKADKGRGIF